MPTDDDNSNGRLRGDNEEGGGEGGKKRGSEGDEGVRERERSMYEEESGGRKSGGRWRIGGTKKQET